MFSVKLVTTSNFGKNIQNSNFYKTGKRVEQIMKSNSDVEFIQQFGKTMLEDSKRFVPVRTGRLRDSLTLEKTSTGFNFYQDSSDSGAPYGYWVEHGSSRNRNPKPYFWPSVVRNEEKMITALKNYYRKGTK
ncbi:MAG: hypothetical protein R2685_10915 [Candidatus Nitrosocosmicus sp.]|nr:hypothetical protein [Candidatus Nitrosocosmicus sp.]